MGIMRRALSLLALLCLPACASWLPDLSDIPGAETLGLAMPMPEAEVEEVPASAQAAAAGEPALHLRWGSRAVVAVLAQQSGENRMWRSPGGMVVATDGARVVATAGLRDWLAATRLDGPDPLDEPLQLLGREVASRRQVDLMRSDRSPEGMRFGLSLNCRLRGSLTDGVQAPPALLITERCRGSGESFVNRFWADPETGGIYRSEQWIGPPGPLWVEVVNPPSS
ncbi:YjbF family lipoprotein [Roseomonas sp. ACRSG]|nr:YjbF family lipoprotein [Roseomonas sp. ACRSG]